MALIVMAMGRLVDMPHIMKQIIVQSKPLIRMGFRPYLSAALPQPTAVMDWAKEKTEDVSPAHFATLFWGTPKLLTMAGRYGFTEV